MSFSPSSAWASIWPSWRGSSLATRGTVVSPFWTAPSEDKDHVYPLSPPLQAQAQAGPWTALSHHLQQPRSPRCPGWGVPPSWEHDGMFSEHSSEGGAPGGCWDFSARPRRAAFPRLAGPQLGGACEGPQPPKGGTGLQGTLDLLQVLLAVTSRHISSPRGGAGAVRADPSRGPCCSLLGSHQVPGAQTQVSCPPKDSGPLTHHLTQGPQEPTCPGSELGSGAPLGPPPSHPIFPHGRLPERTSQTDLSYPGRPASAEKARPLGSLSRLTPATTSALGSHNTWGMLPLSPRAPPGVAPPGPSRGAGGRQAENLKQQQKQLAVTCFS